MPSQILLRFLEVTSAKPAWLLGGECPRFRPRAQGLSIAMEHGKFDVRLPVAAVAAR